LSNTPLVIHDGRTDLFQWLKTEG